MDYVIYNEIEDAMYDLRDHIEELSGELTNDEFNDLSSIINKMIEEFKRNFSN